MDVGTGSVIGSVINGIFGLAGAAAERRHQIADREAQQAHDKDMAALNQSNSLEQMAIQNKYQVEQWNRENEYNDPAAVAQRYRDAGINPRAALGGAASGAGVAGSLSSAPSGSSTGSASNIMGHSNVAGALSSAASGITQSLQIDAQNAANKAAAKLAEERAESERYERDFVKPSVVALNSALADKNATESEIAKIELQWRPYMLELESREKEGNINQLAANVNFLEQRLLESKSVQALNKEQLNVVREQSREIAERTLNYAFQRRFLSAQTAYEKAATNMFAYDQALKQAQKGHLESLKKQVDKEVEFISKKMELTDQQIRKIKNDIARKWSEFGVNTALGTSAEVRRWLMPWGDKSNPISKISSPDEPFFFAD